LPQQSLLSIYNAYTQFSYLILGYIFANTFTKDYQRGIYYYFEQM